MCPGSDLPTRSRGHANPVQNSGAEFRCRIPENGLAAERVQQYTGEKCSAVTLAGDSSIGASEGHDDVVCAGG